MRILFVTENFARGGLDTFLATLINHWPDADDSLSLLVNDSHPGISVIESRLERPCTIVRHRIPLLWQMLARLQAAGVPGALRKIVSGLLRYPMMAIYLFAMGRQLRRIGADRLMVVNGGYPGGDTCRAATIMWRTRNLGPRSVHNFHNFAVPAQWWQVLPERLIDRLCHGASTAFVSVSRSCAASLSVRGFLAPGEQARVIYNGIAFPSAPQSRDLAPRRALGIADDAVMFLVLATYEPRKGHAFLLNAFALVARSHANARLVICGHGDDAQIGHVRDLAAALGLGDVVSIHDFRGDAAALMATTDVLVVPSQSFESFGLTALEAMALNKPVVATRVGGLPEVLDDGRAGMLVARDDVDGLAAALGRLAGDAALRLSVGRQGYEFAAARFQADDMARAYAQLIKNPDGAGPLA